MDLEGLTLGALLDGVCAKSPTPGGGAVASVVGALSAALAGMVVNYSVGKKSLAAHEPELRAALSRLEHARAMLIQLAREDAESFGAMNELTRLPVGDPRRAAELPGAALAAFEAPRSTIAVCSDLLRLFESLGPITNRGLRSDLAIAAILAEAVARASRWNVVMNLAAVQEAGGLGRPPLELLAETDRVLEDAAERSGRIQRSCV
jgi:formiminotetrahydrofolate cyclodeaminase